MIPFFATIPHSGERVPSEATWLQGLSEPVLMRDVDRFVDRLYEPSLLHLQIPFIKTQWHRYVIDLNRWTDDVDCDSVKGHPNPTGKFSRGLHWILTTEGERLMAEPMSQEMHQKFIDLIFKPFHGDVKKQFAVFKEQGAKQVYHVDLHSMPSKGTTQHRDPGQTRASIVISDCEQKSCSTQFRDLVIDAYRAEGFDVAYNWPYMGGRVTETYGHPELGQHSIQIELNRALYMDESTKREKAELWPHLQKKLGGALAAVQRGVQKLSDS